MQYQPHRKLKPLVIVCFPLLVVALLFWGLAYLNVGPNGVNQLGMLATLTALIYLLIRYALTEFVYQLSEEDNIFTVTKVGGKRPRTVADLRLSRGDRILPYEKGTCKKLGVMRTENYCVSLFPRESWLLLTVIDGSLIALRLECREDVARLIRERIDSLPQEDEE
ncbi:MAG: hypothetical protein IJW62_08025 [Clostridia bacterium]|nr:hypothetical protein [Clostridia bacterium]